MFRGRLLAAAAGREAQCCATYKSRLQGSLHSARAAFEASLSGHHDEEAVRKDLAALGEPSDRDSVEEAFEAAAREVDELLERPDVWQAIEGLKDALLARGDLSRADARLWSVSTPPTLGLRCARRATLA